MFVLFGSRASETYTCCSNRGDIARTIPLKTNMAKKMKKQIIILFAVIGILFPKITIAQYIDTIIDVGDGYQLHFTIIKGKTAPILFESGLGNGADVWKNITKQIADVTGATIITYDRLSYSERPQTYQISFENEIKALELGLQKLGYANNSMMLVAHSLDGMYCSYYASRHPNEIKAAVFIDDANICSLKSHFKLAGVVKDDTVENYLANILTAVTKKTMPLNIPLTDIVADTHFDDNGANPNLYPKRVYVPFFVPYLCVTFRKPT